MNKTFERWTVDKSAELYGIREWGGGYFDVSEKGHVVVMPSPGMKDQAVSIRDIISGIKQRGMDMPVLLRIENILDAQISHLNETFLASMKDLGYKGTFMGAYPIKVNQQQQVIDAVTHFGARYHHGLEAGSKAELIAAMGMLRDRDACLVCNGYKDEEFIDLALSATKMGYKCIMVIEMPGELPLILERAEALGATPLLGVRIKLASRAGGHWSESGGDRSIFGLNTQQIIEAVDMLKAADMLDSLQMVHYHIGSQVSNIREIRTAVGEACRVYAGLAAEGANMRYLDLGGGLAVDYDGSNTNFMSSRNYTLQEYCTDVVEAVMTTLDEQKVPHPVIITESGRALVAYYSVLLFNTLDVTTFEPDDVPDTLPEGVNPQIGYMHVAFKSLSLRNMQECLNDIIYYRDEARQLFNHGKITLRERSLAENIFWKTVAEIRRLSDDLKHVPQEIKDIEAALSDIYYCNFSVFQSLPDAWAIGQLFPIMPVHRLTEEPQRQGILADITCDCDGKIDRFIDRQGVKRALPLHDLRESEEYYLGAFLVGAYQETLGDLHNLLGDTNVITVRIRESGGFDFVNELEGDSVADVLSYVEYDPKALLVKFRETAEDAVQQGFISARERRDIMHAFRTGLHSYTYFER
ncbi:MAG: biosynthetic arginine decarboxylase [Desulfovibrionaceae bacterium]